MLCLKKRRTYSFTQGACKDLPRRSTNEKNGYNEALSMAVTTLPRKHRNREERSSAGGMVLTVTEDTPADMLAGSMELLVQLPTDNRVHTQRVTVPRSTPMMDLLVQIATAHKLGASSYTLQAIGERGLVLPHQPNTPIGALDALQVKLLPKQGTILSRKTKQANQPFETTFRLQVLLPRNQLYVSRVSPKIKLGKILEEVCREKNLDKNKYELRHPANLDETLDLSSSLQDYNLQEVTLYAKQGRTLGAALSSQDIMALQRQEERRRQQAKQSVFGFMFRKSKESSLSIDSLGGRSVSPARSDETGRSVSPLAPPPRPLRKRRPAPKPPVRTTVTVDAKDNGEESKEKIVISHSRNSSDSSGYHEASVLSDNPESNGRMPETTLPRRDKEACKLDAPRKLALTSQSSKSLGNLAMASGGLSHGISSTSINSTGVRKKRVAPPPPPIARPLSSAISSQALERIVDSEESLTSDIDISKSPSDIAGSSKANSDIGVNSKTNSEIEFNTTNSKPSSEIGYKIDTEFRAALAGHDEQPTKNLDNVDNSCRNVRSKPVGLTLKIVKPISESIDRPIDADDTIELESARLVKREASSSAPIPKPRSIGSPLSVCDPELPVALRRRAFAQTATRPATIRSSNPSQISEVTVNEKTIDVVDHDCPKEITDQRKIDDSPHLEISRKYNEEDGKKNFLRMKKARSTITNEEINRVDRLGLKQTRSIDEICKFSLEHDDKKKFDKSSSISCAVISTIPKCVYLTSKDNDDDDDDDELNEKFVETKKKLFNRRKCEISKTTRTTTTTTNKNDVETVKRERETRKRSKVFRSQSSTNDFDVNSFEKHSGHLTSDPESFTCALNPNVSRKISKTDIEDSDVETTEPTANLTIETSKGNVKTIVDDDPTELKSVTNFGMKIDDYPPFAVHGTNWRGRKLFPKSGTVRDSSSRMIEKSASVDRTTETDILLQRVSDTLSNSLPSAVSTDRPSPATSKIPIDADQTKKSRNNDSNEKPPIVSRSNDDRYDNREKKILPKDVVTIGRSAPIERSKPIDKTEIDSRVAIASENNFAISSTPNATINSQQDTSDYVSATGDDLSIADWDYQLPAPPSAFRDDDSTVFDDYDNAISRSSVKSLDNTLPIIVKTEKILETSSNIVETPIFESSIRPAVVEQIIDSSTTDFHSKNNVQTIREEVGAFSDVKPRSNVRSSIDEVTVDLKKDVINELSNKIENGSLVQQSNGRINDQEFRRTIDESSAPKIAPSDNTLSNFTITTYSRPKSLNIFEDNDELTRSRVSRSNTTIDKFVDNHSTIIRSKSISRDNEEILERKNSSNSNNCVSSSGRKMLKRSPSVENVDDSEDESRTKFSTSLGNEKLNVVHRSKSHISVVDNSKYRENSDADEIDAFSTNKRDDRYVDKFTGATSVDRETLRSNEKFSQWRENILKRQEETSKEKQLQSLQVMKNILPRLKTDQQTEKNVAEYSNRKDNSQVGQSMATSESHPNESNSTTTMTSTSMESESKSEKKSEDATTRRYKYAGPPAISLGSWSERPRVNVQLKMDTDYKFATNEKSLTKTIVNLNRTNVDEIPSFRSTENSIKFSSNNVKNDDKLERSEKCDFNDSSIKKSTNNETTSTKKSTSNRTIFPSTKFISRSLDVKPMVTSVALKKINVDVTDSRDRPIPRNDPDDDVKIDTKSVNFKDLAKTFGEEVCLRSKTKRSTLQNRHSDYCGATPVIVNNFVNRSNDDNSRNVDATKNRGSTTEITGDALRGPIGRYTSIIGIRSQTNDDRPSDNADSTMKNRNNVIVKTNGLVPVVKGFKMQQSQSNFAEIGNGKIVNAKNDFTTSMKAKNEVTIGNNNHVVPPAPPTMPIITGVTLKNSNARSKSILVDKVDSRDELLESIRNFGGRNKLKNVSS